MQALCQKQYWGKILGCAGGWFFFDITFYGNNLFQPTVLEDIFGVHHNKSAPVAPAPVHGDVHTNRAIQMLLLALIALPGYYVAVCTMDCLGRRVMQLQGFFFMFALYLTLGLGLGALEHTPALLFILYGLTFFFSNFGPNSTTFILPAETFPADLRTTLNGFSAACGKAGATLGASMFVPLKAAVGLGDTMVVCAAVSLVGLLITMLFVEDRRGKDMEGEGDAGLLANQAPLGVSGVTPAMPQADDANVSLQGRKVVGNVVYPAGSGAAGP